MRTSLSLLFCLSLAACGNHASNTNSDGGNNHNPDGSNNNPTTDGGNNNPTTDGGGSGSNLFPSFAHQDISNAPIDSESTTIMNALAASGWDSGRKLGIDASFVILNASASVMPRPFTEDPSALPDCDTAPVPVPPGGRIEGNTDYSCADGGDCHLLVFQGSRLYELYQADISGGMASGGTFTGGCLVVWDTTHDYWASSSVGASYSRGDGCNGADAADLPIAPLVLTAAEVKAGAVNHALRFTLPNANIRANVYVHPATHIGGPSGGTDTMPYGAHLRLRADYKLADLPSDAARVVARALQQYGMFMADGGHIYISATDDIATAINPSDLSALTPADFDMVDGGQRINWHNQNCTRTPISQ